MMRENSAFVLIAALLLCFCKFAGGQGNAEAVKFSREGFQATKDKDWNKAVAAFGKAAELDSKQAPNLIAALQQRGAAYTNEQKFPKAIADFSEALKMKPNDAGIYERRAYVEMKMNDLDKALADYSEAIRLNPDEIRYYLYRGYIYEKKGDIKKSMADTEKALKLDKHNAEALSRKERLQKIQSMNAPAATPPGSKSP
ncbi:MAG: tetratricopeptide repeat protein [Chthoniobacterales bacterium]